MYSAEFVKAVWRRTPPWALIALLLLGFGAASLFFPFGRDQGIHAQVGGAWLDGQLPYRDVWHPKGFLSFVPHLLATAVFGHTMWGIRLVDLLWQFGNGLLIYGIGQRRMGRRGAVTAVGIYYLVYYAFGYWHLAQPEGFLTLFVLVAVWLYERAGEGERPFRWLLASGFMMALAPWFKQTALVFMVALLVWAVYDGRRSGKIWKRVSILLGGMVLATGMVVVFTAVTGMLGPMLTAFRYIIFEYPQRTQTTLLELGNLSIYWGIWFPILIFPFLGGLGYLLSNRIMWPQWMGLILLALAGLGSVYLQRQLWPYHWVSSLPFMVLVGAFLLDKIMVMVADTAVEGRVALGWFVAFLCLGLVLPPLSRILESDVQVALYLGGRVSREEYLAEYEMAEVMAVVDYLQEETAENDPIFVWGHYAMIYYLAERPNPTRFNNDTPLVISHSESGEWHNETSQALASQPPAYIIIAGDDTTSFEPLPSSQQLSAFPTFANFLEENYVLDTTIGSFELYKQVN